MQPTHKHLPWLIIALGLVLITCLPGCKSEVPQVVTTRIAYDRTAGTLDIVSPKDVTIKQLKTQRQSDGSLTVDLQGYAATANAGALNAAEAEAQSRAQMFALLAQTTAAALGRAPVVLAPLSPAPAVHDVSRGENPQGATVDVVPKGGAGEFNSK